MKIIVDIPDELGKDFAGNFINGIIEKINNAVKNFNVDDCRPIHIYKGTFFGSEPPDIANHLCNLSFQMELPGWLWDRNKKNRGNHD